ncbi:MAG: acetyl-CoA C-acetyltransferase [Burkholderiales bacterium]|nr:acetyl-CoA C-acetyltransferase [Burkholderiales bacterium]OUT79607.1 MAG: acetyl-CoA acetyltransferase [Betaproteobacteria bacterium TMED22]
MNDAYIVTALRTAGGKKGGRLSNWHPVDLGAQVINALLNDIDCPPSVVEDVIFGSVSQIGEQAMNVARNIVLASELPESVPATSVDRQCGSSQQALHFAAQAVMSGTMDIVIAGGVESMTRTPMFSTVLLPQKNGLGHYMSPELQLRYPNIEFSQFKGAEMMANQYAISKDELDAYALNSHRRASEAVNKKAFEKEIVPIAIRDTEGIVTGETHNIDEGVRFDANLESIAGIKPILDGGLLTAGTASQICDGASGLIVCNENGLKILGVEPLVRISHMSVIGHDPVIMLEAPIPATKKALKKTDMTIDSIDLFEVNEAFASVPVAWSKALHVEHHKVNVNGGAIALGHPLGSSGTKLATTLIHSLRTRHKKLGLQTMCEGGGMANVTIFENCQL